MMCPGLWLGSRNLQNIAPTIPTVQLRQQHLLLVCWGLGARQQQRSVCTQQHLLQHRLPVAVSPSREAPSESQREAAGLSIPPPPAGVVAEPPPPPPLPPSPNAEKKLSESSAGETGRVVRVAPHSLSPAAARAAATRHSAWCAAVLITNTDGLIGPDIAGRNRHVHEQKA